MSIPGTYINSEKLSLTSWTLSVSSSGVTENSSEIKQCSILNLFVSTKKPSETQIQQLGLGNLVEEPNFLCNSDPHYLASFLGALENLASQSKAKMENLFLDIETTLKIKLGSIL